MKKLVKNNDKKFMKIKKEIENFKRKNRISLLITIQKQKINKLER